MTYNCSCLATDVSKIFEVYWLLATPTSHIPVKWPTQYRTGINLSESERMVWTLPRPWSIIIIEIINKKMLDHK